MDFAAAMPLAGTLGVTIQEGTRERVTGRLPVRPDICTAGNIVHGGAIMGELNSAEASDELLGLMMAGMKQTAARALLEEANPHVV